MDATPSIKCECRVVGEKIIFCRLHAAAASLLSACEYLRKVILTVKLATPGQENLIREIVLPYAEKVIKRASKPLGE